ncbi:TraR/DksA C4-type zinc finger protein [bacterium]|nr:TraR/DksA C4-type zinc finger protein [bacterium]RQV97953.1 MAG: TraR/DksA family transcriptional regulator [bacterium]
MNKKDRDYFKSVLLKFRQDLMGQIDQVKENDLNSTLRDAAGDHSAYSYHMADQGTDNMEREKNFFYVQRDNHTMQDIIEALERIEAGTFGMCVECGQKINRDRLEAMPYAIFCVQCKSDLEKITRNNHFMTGDAF